MSLGAGGGGETLTCGEGGGGDAAPLGILGRLQEDCVVGALRQALQSDPRVLRVHNQLLRSEGVGGDGRVGPARNVGHREGESHPTAGEVSIAVATLIPSIHNGEKTEPIGRQDSCYRPGARWDEGGHLGYRIQCFLDRTGSP